MATARKKPAPGASTKRDYEQTEHEATVAAAPRQELLVSAAAFERKAGEPVWSQIARSVEEQIVAGNLPSGTRLPTETQLATSFEVNRHTLRRALRELV
ncbi:MAG: GntR family transcriptional regulator, partial [Hyphomicrobiaceae bacterium]